MKIYEISKDDFKAMDGPRKLITHELPRRFAALDLGGRLGTFGLSWRSDRIDPIIIRSGDSILWIGVDQHLAAIDLNFGNIRFSTPLSSNLLQLITNNELTAVLTEIEVMLFNSNLSIRMVKGLPDIPDSLSLDNDEMMVKTVDGQALRFDIETGGIKSST